MEGKATLRQRATTKVPKEGGLEIRRAEKSKGNTQSAITQQNQKTKRPPPSGTAGILEALGVICLILAVLVGLVAYIYHFEPTTAQELEVGLAKASAYAAQLFSLSPKESLSPAEKAVSREKFVPKIYAVDELREFDGSDPSKPILLGILGKVYDVSKGKKHYAKGGSYSFFAGRDASRSFATGAFQEESLTDDVDDLEPEQVAGIYQWQQQFERDYKYLGKLVGRFYDAAGKPAPGLKKVKEKLKKAKITGDKEEEEKRQFPECNSRWTEADGTTIWCSEASGGIARTWKGYPRQFKSAVSRGMRCACVRKKHLNDPRVRPYEKCDPLARECHL